MKSSPLPRDGPGPRDSIESSLPLGRRDLPSSPFSTREQLTLTGLLLRRGLTPRDAEAVLRVVGGKPVLQVAAEMQVTRDTAKTLLARARRKSRCRSLRELSAWVHRERDRALDVSARAPILP